MTFLRFLNPVALLLMVCLPLAVWLAVRTLAGITGVRRALAVALRLAILSLLIMALAETVVVKRHNELCVFFLADRSSSIPSEHQHAAIQIVNALCREMTEKDRAGLIVFGADASIEESPQRDYASLKKESVRSVIRRDQTDIGGAIRLALARFPENVQRRIVLISDGNQNRGEALEQARNARAAGVDVLVLPYKFRYPEEVLVEKVVAPSQVQQAESFDVKTLIESTDPGPATLRMYQDDQLIASRDVTLRAGKNVFAVRRQLWAQGFYTFRATVESPQDTLSQNNDGFAFTVVHGTPRVLVIQGRDGEADYIKGFMKQENIHADVAGVASLPASVGALQSYDSVVLVNVPAFDLSRNQMRMIESAVRDFGTGLVMVGGDRSFGAGGYQRTPVEAALPVSMEVKQKKVMPNGALALILHTCEIPDGNRWAVEIGKEAVKVLSPYDQVGILSYDWQSGGDAWSIPLRVIKSKAEIFSLMEGIMPGDMPAFDPTLRLAYGGLKSCNAASKHIVLISDGDPSPPSPALVRQIAAAGISVTTIIIAPHGVSNFSVMRGLARDTKGRFYDVKNANDLPRIFIKEALMVRRSLIFEKRFTPKLVTRTEPLYGLEGVPSLLGYVTTTAKKRSRVSLVGDPPNEDPILAQWRYGLGKAAAFTSDAKNRWAAEWVPWQGFGKFWTQLIRWSMRSVPRSDLSISTHAEQGRGRISVDAVDERGDYINFLKLQAEIVSPKMKRSKVVLRQTAAGHYDGEFPTDEVGAYLMRIETRSKDEQVSAMQVTGLAVSYSPEYRDLSTDYPLLHALARESGGRMITLEENVFMHDPRGSEASRDIWWGLALAALLILPFDIALRRLVIDFSPVYAFFRRVAAVLLRPFVRRSQAERERDEVMERLRARKAATRATRPAAVMAPPPETPGGEEVQTLTGEEDSAAPQREKKKVESGPEAEAREEGADYTRRLLEAKRRALKGRDSGGESE